MRAERRFLLASGVITLPKIALAGAYFAYALWYFISTGGNAPSYLFLGVALFAILAGAILYLFAPIQHFKEAAKLQERYQMTFHEFGIELVTPSLRSDVKWENYIALWESEDDYYLVRRGRRYTQIPKRAFPDAEMCTAFETLALEKIGKPKRLL